MGRPFHPPLVTRHPPPAEKSCRIFNLKVSFYPTLETSDNSSEIKVGMKCCFR